MSRSDPNDLANRLGTAGFRGALYAECPLAPFTTWRIGGPAEVLARPRDAPDLALAARWAATEGIPWKILGNGSNLLVRDEGVRGLVLRVRKTLEEIGNEGHRLTAGAGASFPAVARRAAGLGLSGIEFGAGIPGTIGGAVVMNAGWHEFEIGNVVDWVDVLDDDGTTRRLDRAACGFGYRNSRFRGRQEIVLAAGLRLDPAEPAEIHARMLEYAASRKANQPTGEPSCGSVFLKPEGDFAGRLIDEAGLKGLRIGDIQVSTLHANFFVNLGHGTAHDVLTLVERVEREVETKFGVSLVREFELW